MIWIIYSIPILTCLISFWRLKIIATSFHKEKSRYSENEIKMKERWLHLKSWDEKMNTHLDEKKVRAWKKRVFECRHVHGCAIDLPGWIGNGLLRSATRHLGSEGSPKSNSNHAQLRVLANMTCSIMVSRLSPRALCNGASRPRRPQNPHCHSEPAIRWTISTWKTSCQPRKFQLTDTLHFAASQILWISITINFFHSPQFFLFKFSYAKYQSSSQCQIN